MMKRRDKRSLRSGYTSGTCAAAAAQAATTALLKQEVVNQVRIDLPGAGEVNFRVNRCRFDHTQASCSVIKDAGDDPDITNGAEIRATVFWKAKPGIEIRGGEGVGTVTKPGLEIPIGMAAINLVPHKMIERSVRKIAQNEVDERGIQVIISVPGGEKLVKRTLNPRLGIVNGISILGTTGIVIPYSVNAYKTCISQALDVAVACGCCQVVLTTGRRSEKFAQNELGLAEECFVQAGDFIGYSLRECTKKHLNKVTVWGMIGKLSKLAAGHLYTNVSHSKVDIGFLAGVAASCGVPDRMIKALRSAVTASHFYKMLPPECSRGFCDQLCLLAAEKCREEARRKLEVECIMTSFDGIILGRANAKR